MSTSSRLGLSYVLPAQAQKHVPVNESLRRLDALVHCAVRSAALSEEPSGPIEGEAFILPEGRSGAAWSAIPAGHIAVWQDGAFAAVAPFAGLLAYVADEARLLVHDGESWTSVGGVADNLPFLGVNTTADALNRLAVKADAMLLTHDDVTPGSGDARSIINKDGPAQTASLLLQTGFSGRAEIGLIGDDALCVKVSPDGESFTEVLRADPATGNIALRRHSAERALHIGGPADPGLRLQEDGSDGFTELLCVDPSQTLLSHIAPAGNDALIDLAPLPSDGMSSAAFRFFRNTATTHGCYLTIHAGDGSAEFNHRLSGKWDSFLQARSGKLRVGSTEAPACTLDVAGPVRVASYGVGALPPAATGAGQIIYVPDAQNGAVLAFSDGTDWRRSDDRAVVV